MNFNSKNKILCLITIASTSISGVVEYSLISKFGLVPTLIINFAYICFLLGYVELST